MDSALLLRSSIDSGEELSNDEIDSLLNRSQLVQQLTSDSSNKPLFNIWSLVALAEIPFSGRLGYTKRVVNYVQNNLFSGSVYSFDAKDDSVLTCYNAMITRSLIKLGFLDKRVQKSIDWILKYQPVNRVYLERWEGSASKKYGGCFKNTPCYIGIVKNIKALVEYSKHISYHRIKERIREGLEYLLEHHVVFRLSKDEPITKHILDLSFPESYNLNCIELFLLLHETGKIGDPRVKELLDYLESKKANNDYWKVNYAYKADGYVCFDSKGKNAEWTTYIIKKCFAEIA